MTKKPKTDTQEVKACSTGEGYDKTDPLEASFPIIGIGASAGGLEALQLN